jgi:hypothetical protein
VSETSRREFLVTGVSALALSAAIFRSVQGWLGAAQQYAGMGLKRPSMARITPPPSEEIDPAAHILNRLTFGAGPGDHGRVSAMGVEAFINEQLAPDKIDDTLCDRAIARFAECWWEPLGEAYEEDDESLSPVLRRVALLRATYSKRQLFEVMCEFWSDHFNIDPGKGDCRYAKIADDQNTIRKHALGNFREMLHASALSPAMLWYLDGRANTKRTPDEKPNENYARELMELHTLGVHGGYSQQDVMEVARCLTGWTVLAKKNDGFSGKLLSPFKDRAKSVFRAEAHDDGSKVVLGQEIPAGGKEKDLDRVIDIVASHPSTAKYIAGKLCMRFIGVDAPASAVDAVATAFAESKGDIKTMLRTLFRNDAYRNSHGFAVQAAASLRRLRLARDERGSRRRDAAPPISRKDGTSPRFATQHRTDIPLEASHWYSTLLWRWKFALALANNDIKGTKVDRKLLDEALGGDSGLIATLSQPPT